MPQGDQSETHSKPRKMYFTKGVRLVYTTLVLCPETVTADTQCCCRGINIKAQWIPSFLGHLKNNKTFSHCSRALTTDVCVFHTKICWLSLLIMSACQMSSKGFFNSSANKWFHIWLLSFSKDRGRPSQLEIKCSFAFKWWSVYECTAWHNTLIHNLLTQECCGGKVGEINQVISNAIIDQSRFTQGLAKLTGISLG